MIRLIESSLLSPISSLLGPYPLSRQSVIININLELRFNNQMTRFTTLLLCSVAFAVPTKHEVDPPCNLAKCLKLGAMCALAITQPALAGSALNGGSNALAAHQSQALQKSAPALSVEGVRNRKLKNALTSPEMSPPTVEQMSSPPPLVPNAPLDFANMHVNQLSDYVIANPNMIKEVYNSISKKQGPGFYYSKYIQFYYVVVSDGNKQLVIAAPLRERTIILASMAWIVPIIATRLRRSPGAAINPAGGPW